MFVLRVDARVTPISSEFARNVQQLPALWRGRVFGVAGCGCQVTCCLFVGGGRNGEGEKAQAVPEEGG